METAPSGAVVSLQLSSYIAEYEIKGAIYARNEIG